MSAPYWWLDWLLTSGTARTLSRSELLILLALGKHVNTRTLKAWPGAQTLAELAGLSVKTAYKTLDNLQARGLISGRTETVHRSRRTYAVRVYRLESAAFERDGPGKGHSLQPETVTRGIVAAGDTSNCKELSTRTGNGTGNATSHTPQSRSSLRSRAPKELGSSGIEMDLSEVNPCPVCEGRWFWLPRSGEVRCATYTPPGDKEVVRQWRGQPPAGFLP